MEKRWWIFSFVLISVMLVMVVSVTEAKRRGVSIPDELDDVVDDEEDEAWKLWGQKKKKDDDVEEFKPPDLSNMDPAEIQKEMMRLQVGPAMGFVKLRLGVPRTKEDIPMIAMRWTKVLRTGSLEVKFTGIDLTTIMFTMDRGKDTQELKDFVLSQPEAYEIKIGDQVFRRPGDPPLEEVVEMLRKKREEEAKGSNDEL